MALLQFRGNSVNTKVFHRGDGFFYHLNNTRPNRRFAYLRCIHYKSFKHQCPGTAKASMNEQQLYHLRDHSHAPNVLYPEVQSLKREIFTRVKSGEQTSFHEIMQQEGQRYSMEVRAQVGLGSIISRMNTLRSQLRPPVPRSLGVLGACLLLPQYEYLTKCLHAPESMFAGMCGSMHDRTLSLVFISSEFKELMRTRKMVFADGTKRKLFRKPKASQIYVISAAWRFHALVMLRAIMVRRTQEAYEALFDFILNLMPDFNPDSVKCDFEIPHINAWHSRFPTASIEGCLWHYAMAAFSYPKKKLGLYQLVKDEEEVEGIIRSAGALPLLPTNDIEGGLEDLAAEALQKGWMPQLRAFFQYWERTWLPHIPDLSVAGSIHRTNNISESSNRSYNKEVKVSNPSCFSVLRAFVVTNDKYTCDMHTLASGFSPGRARRISSLRNDAEIKRATTDYNNGDITRLQFLHRASRRLQNVFNKVYT